MYNVQGIIVIQCNFFLQQRHNETRVRKNIVLHYFYFVLFCSIIVSSKHFTMIKYLIDNLKAYSIKLQLASLIGATFCFLCRDCIIIQTVLALEFASFCKNQIWTKVQNYLQLLKVPSELVYVNVVKQLLEV